MKNMSKNSLGLCGNFMMVCKYHEENEPHVMSTRKIYQKNNIYEASERETERESVWRKIKNQQRAVD